MNSQQFFTASDVLIVAGKGGVGKTAVSAILTTAASNAGLKTLLVEVEGKSGVASFFNAPALSYEESVLIAPTSTRGEATGRTLSPDDALIEYLKDRGLNRITQRLARTGAVDLIATSVPGIRDVLVLGKIKQLQRSGDYDLIIVDAPAAGHAVSFLRSATGLQDAVNVGPIRQQATEVLELLNDPDRCSVVLVTLPEETPVNELIQTAYSLEDEVGVQLGPVIVNGILGEISGLNDELGEVGLTESDLATLTGSRDFYLSRQNVQRKQLDRLASELPLRQIPLPFIPTTALRAGDIRELADKLLVQLESEVSH